MWQKRGPSGVHGELELEELSAGIRRCAEEGPAVAQDRMLERLT